MDIGQTYTCKFMTAVGRHDNQGHKARARKKDVQPMVFKGMVTVIHTQKSETVFMAQNI